jgi:hypothetical protein
MSSKLPIGVGTMYNFGVIFLLPADNANIRRFLITIYPRLSAKSAGHNNYLLKSNFSSPV